jgi:hypothetical protein
LSNSYSGSPSGADNTACAATVAQLKQTTVLSIEIDPTGSRFALTVDFTGFNSGSAPEGTMILITRRLAIDPHQGIDMNNSSIGFARKF